MVHHTRCGQDLGEQLLIEWNIPYRLRYFHATFSSLLFIIIITQSSESEPIDLKLIYHTHTFTSSLCSAFTSFCANPRPIAYGVRTQMSSVLVHTLRVTQGLKTGSFGCKISLYENSSPLFSGRSRSRCASKCPLEPPQVWRER